MAKNVEHVWPCEKIHRANNVSRYHAKESALCLLFNIARRDQLEVREEKENSFAEICRELVKHFAKFSGGLDVS